MGMEKSIEIDPLFPEEMSFDNVKLMWPWNEGQKSPIIIV